MYFLRVLAPILIAWAGAVSAEPDCEEENSTGPAGFVAHENFEEFAATFPEATVAVVRNGEITVSPRPRLRPCKFRMFEIGRQRMRERGAVCGDWTIIGETLEPIAGKYQGCGIAEPVRIRVVSDILLSQLAVMDCRTAVTLKTWLENTAKPAFADQGGGLKGLRLSGHYACKTQNNKPGGRLSEHARGRAIDVSSFILIDGTVITVRDGWNNNETKDVMRQLHSGACGVFGTVLGPDADRYHQGHFHLDTARHRREPYCR